MIILFNKPFNVLSQFTDKSNNSEERKTLAHFINIKQVYSARRLDLDRGGLVILTDDGSLQSKISSPKFKIEKTYLVHFEGISKEKDLHAFRKGLELKDVQTKPAKVRTIEEPKWLWERNPPIRVRKTISDSWIELKIKEGKNRQVRPMTANIGFPTLRLIRISIGKWNLDELKPGDFKVL